MLNPDWIKITQSGQDDKPMYIRKDHVIAIDLESNRIILKSGNVLTFSDNLNLADISFQLLGEPK